VAASPDERFWRDSKRLRAEVEKHGSLRAAALAHGVNFETLRSWWHRHKLGDFPNGPKAPRPDEDLEAWLKARLTRGKDAPTVAQLADEADVSPRRVRQAVERLRETGLRIPTPNGAGIVLERVPPASSNVYKATPALFDGEHVRFAVISDTHLGSKEHRAEELETAYEMIARESIRVVYHPGDLVAGMGVYRHQLRDLAVIGFDSQVAHAIEHYPRREGVETYIIAGNHDLEGDYGRMAADPVTAVCSARDDMHACGYYDAWFELPNGGRIHVLHPGGGSSYALSYKAQKLAEGYEGGRKPNLLLLGHYHRQGVFEHRGIVTVLCGTFEGSTNLAKRYGMGPPAVGFHVIDCVMADDGSLVDFGWHWRPFFAGRKAKVTA
jgi:predicted phosphodiesterase/transposase-like protein